MTLLQIKKQIAALMNKSLADFTVDGEDICLVALNQARSTAELAHDFEFNRQVLTLTVDGVTGGSLASAVLQGTATIADVKTVVDIGVFDTDNNFCPVEWTTVAESMERQRGDNWRFNVRYPTDGQVQACPRGIGRFVVRNGSVYRWPLDTAANNDYSIGIEAYVMQADWTAADLAATTVTVTGTISPDITGTYTLRGVYNDAPIYTKRAATTGTLIYSIGLSTWVLYATTSQGFDEMADYWGGSATKSTIAGSYPAVGVITGTATVTAGTSSTTDIWTKYADDYLIWSAIITLNHRFKTFVPRTEGNLPPPAQLAAQSLQDLIDWDAAKFDANRRHGR